MINDHNLLRQTGQLGNGLGSAEIMFGRDALIISQCSVATTTKTSVISTTTATPEATTRTTKMRKWQYGCQKQEVYKSGTYYFLKSPGVSAKLSKEMNDAFDGNLHNAGTPCGGVS